MTATPGGTLTQSGTLFRASRPVMLLEHFRVPYEIADAPAGRESDEVRLGSSGPALVWRTTEAGSGPPLAAALSWEPGPPIPIFARITSDRAAASLLAQRGGSWAPIAGVVSMNGHRLASVWRADDGSVFLPFDPDEVRLNFLSERYHEIMQRHVALAWRRLAMHGYYRVRDIMPRAVQIWLRRRYARVQARTAFPQWPIETGLHDFMEALLSVLGSIAGEPVPTIGSWPSGFTWALVLTHDVETAAGLGTMDRVLQIERSLGLRSSWNFVPRRYEVPVERTRALVSDGWEVGVHGLYHDGRDLESLSVLRERLPGMREAATRWNAVGFRSPATHRDWDLMPLLGFDYDTSYPDTDPFEPQGGGCCTWLPFFNQEVVELPLTMVQDHTLFTILRQPDEHAWVEKAEFLRSRGGMALFDTHPDYLADQRALTAYERFLARFTGDDHAWKALPANVSNWWRRRSQSYLERRGDAWTVAGPAAGEAQVNFINVDAQSPEAFGGGHPNAA